MAVGDENPGSEADVVCVGGDTCRNHDWTDRARVVVPAMDIAETVEDLDIEDEVVLWENVEEIVRNSRNKTIE